MTNSSNKIIYLSVALSSLLLGVLCLIFPVLQWCSFTDNGLLKAALAVAGLSIGICKLAFFPIAGDLLARKKYTSSLVVFGVAVIALSISIASTSNLFRTLGDDKKQAAISKSFAYQSEKQNLNSLESQINALNQIIQTDIDNSYRTRAFEKSKEVTNLVKMKSEAMNRLASLSNPPAQDRQSIFSGSISFGVGRFTASTTGAFLASCTLHILCVISLMIASTWRPTETEIKPLKQDGKADAEQEEKEKTQKKKEKTHQKGELILIAPQLNKEQSILAKRIVSGEFGNEPVLRELIQSGVIAGGYPKVKPVFEHLINSNQLRRNGRKYQLVQTVI